MAVSVRYSDGIWNYIRILLPWLHYIPSIQATWYIYIYIYLARFFSNILCEFLIVH